MIATEQKGIQKCFEYTQTNHGNINQVFPLLCPVREADWIDGWEYKMIFSQSGLVEKNCVFTTPSEPFDTVWQVTQYSPETYSLEFLRICPGKNIVRINIRLHPVDQNTTQAEIKYRYTGLSEEENEYIKKSLAHDFESNMTYWEKALNHYLKYGEKLKK